MPDTTHTFAPPPSQASANLAEMPTLPPGPTEAGAVPGRLVGDYELLAEIARGGMGVVYRARQKSLDREVAVKMILAGQLASAAEVQRFQSEAAAAAHLHHPHIVAIHEIGAQDGHHYFSMEYVQGQSLGDLIRDKPLPAEKAAAYLQAVALAIQYAHENNVLHRDIKPSNILIDAQDQPRITDFGLAKRLSGDSGLTATGQVLGTPSFMPPEQAAGKTELHPAADVYSLGAVLYALLTGRPPFQAAAVFDTLQQVLETEPVPPRLLNPTIPVELETICLKCLEKQPGHRYASAQELADDLKRWQVGEPIKARPPSVPYLARTWYRRHMRMMLGAICVGLVCGLLSSALAAPALDLSLAERLGMPTWAAGLLLLLSLAVSFSTGFLATWYTRTPTREADLAVGAGSGTVCALTFFLLVFGPHQVRESIKYDRDAIDRQLQQFGRVVDTLSVEAAKGKILLDDPEHPALSLMLVPPGGTGRAYAQYASGRLTIMQTAPVDAVRVGMGLCLVLVFTGMSGGYMYGLYSKTRSDSIAFSWVQPFSYKYYAAICLPIILHIGAFMEMTDLLPMGLWLTLFLGGSFAWIVSVLILTDSYSRNESLKTQMPALGPLFLVQIACAAWFAARRFDWFSRFWTLDALLFIFLILLTGHCLLWRNKLRKQLSTPAS